MANAMVTIIFQISDATPIIWLLIRVISDLKVTFNNLLDLDEIFYKTNWVKHRFWSFCRIFRRISAICLFNAWKYYIQALFVHDIPPPPIFTRISGGISGNSVIEMFKKS